VDIYKNEYEKIVETTNTIDEQNNSKSSKSSTHDNFELDYKNVHKESGESDSTVMQESLLKWGTFRYN